MQHIKKSSPLAELFLHDHVHDRSIAR
jgi:hypothetical protein